MLGQNPIDQVTRSQAAVRCLSDSIKLLMSVGSEFRTVLLRSKVKTRRFSVLSYHSSILWFPHFSDFDLSSSEDPDSWEFVCFNLLTHSDWNCVLSYLFHYRHDFSNSVSDNNRCLMPYDTLPPLDNLSDLTQDSLINWCTVLGFRMVF